LLFTYNTVDVGTFTSVFEDNKKLKTPKIVEINVFLNLLLFDGRTRIRSIIADADPGTLYFLDPTDLDLEQ
jgi:hypothetical protein